MLSVSDAIFSIRGFRFQLKSLNSCTDDAKHQFVIFKDPVQTTSVQSCVFLYSVQIVQF